MVIQRLESELQKGFSDNFTKINWFRI